MKTRMIIALTVAGLAILLGLGLRKKNIKTKEHMTRTDTTEIAKRVLNLIILDESGSMAGLEKTSVDGVNETIQTIKGSYEQHHEQEQLLTFITFSSRGDSDYRTQFELMPIPKVDELKYSDYRPCGGTPLYDTMGKALTELEKSATDSDIVLVTIITDGYENSSREYNQTSIKDLISRLDEKDWVFTYIGANQDAILEAGKIGIRNAMNYDADIDGTREMWEKEKRYRSTFMEGARTGVSKKRLKESYFKIEEEEER